jgi:hypothetical protein
MQCQRCLSAHGEVAEYRVRTEVIDDKVCGKCADDARAIGLTVTPLSEEEVQASDDTIAA